MIDRILWILKLKKIYLKNTIFVFVSKKKSFLFIPEIIGYWMAYKIKAIEILRKKIF